MKETADITRWSMNRREFLMAVGGGLCASTLPRNAAGAADQRQPGSEFIESRCEKEAGPKSRVLIAYASRCGSTGGVAETLGRVLCEAGMPVDVRLVGNVSDLSPYRAVILGSAIRMGSWLPEAAEFANKHQDVLGHMPTADFVVCMTMKDDTTENRKTVMAYLDPVRKKAPRIIPASTGLFAGATDFKKLSFVYRAVLKAKGTPEGDFRDWPAIRKWAAEIRPALLKA